MANMYADANPTFRDYVRRVGNEGDFTGIEFLIDVSLKQLINNDKALSLLVGATTAGLDWQDSVLDQDVSDPDTLTPSDGHRYIVAVGGVNDWLGKDDQIAQFNGVDWDFTVPNTGFAALVEDDNLLLIYTGGGWTDMSGLFDHGSLLGKGDDDHTQYLLVSGARAMSGALDMGGFAVSNVGTVDGVDVSTLSSDFSTHTGGTAYSQHTGGLGSHTHQSAGAEGGKIDHGLALDGLGDDDHTQYALLAGRSGGQHIYGGTDASDDLILESTAHATKGEVQVHANDIVVFSDAGTTEVARIDSSTGAMSGASLDLGGGNISNVGTVDGVDVATLGSDFSTHDGGDAKAQHTGGLGTHTHQSAGAEGGKIDHGLALEGLGDDDHTQYILASGGRAFSGDQTFNTGIHHVVTWFIAGAISAAVDQFAFVVPEDFENYAFDGARIYALTAPTDASLIVDVNKNAVTLYTTQGNRPTIASGANDSGDRVAPDVTAIAKGDIITVDVDQVGSTIAGSNLAITLVFVQTAA